MSSTRPPAATAVAGLRPGGRVEGRASVPGSKSQAQRVLVCAGLAEGETEITGLAAGAASGADVRAALALVEAAGARVEPDASGVLRVRGLPPGPEAGWSARGPVSLGESGTLARFATAAFALCGEVGRWHELRGAGTLLRRRSPPLFAALSRAGASIEALSGSGGWPVRVRASARARRIELENPVSSQEASALCIALAAHPGESELSVRGVVPSRTYFDLTARTLREFGVELDRGEILRVRGPLRAPAAPLAIEPDASSAAVVLAAACLSGGRVEVEGIGEDSTQPDARAVELLRRFGVDAGATASLAWAAGCPSRSVDLDLSGTPDLAPVLAVVAAKAALESGEASRLCGLATLPGKESSRIEVLARGLRATGFGARAGLDFLEISRGERGGLRGPILLDPEQDHRMAFAFALLGLVVEGVGVLDPGCVAKSWPGFWNELKGLGASVVERA